MSIIGFEDKEDPDCVKNRAGYVITLAHCPCTWGSCLQSLIALSTMEVEYNALSLAMREILPFKVLVEAVVITIGYEKLEVTTMQTTVWEDNIGALNINLIRTWSINATVTYSCLLLVSCATRDLFPSLSSLGLFLLS
jgi:hypothetical protein